MANFAESFAQTFVPTFDKGIDRGIAQFDKNEARRIEAEQSQQLSSAIDTSFKSIMDMRKVGQADIQGKIEGQKGLAMIDLVSRAHPGAKDAIISATLSTIELESGKPASEEFKKWIKTAKQDEVRATLDFIADQDDS
jgi:hypothetical protein